MTFDFTRAREETPGCLRVAHLNNAGSALPPARVTDAMIDYLRVEARMGGYEAADAHASRVEGTYDAIAALIGAHRDEIAVVENATRAWDMAFYAFDFKPGDKILTGRNEYASNAIAHLQVAARTGAVVEVVEDDEHGQLDLDDLRARVDERVKLISVTHIPTQGGLITATTPRRVAGSSTRRTTRSYSVWTRWTARPTRPPSSRRRERNDGYLPH